MSRIKYLEGKPHRVLANSVYMNGLSEANLMGPDTWMMLNPILLSEEGKKIVSEDPDLSVRTLIKLLDLRDWSLYKAHISLGHDEPIGDEPPLDIGLDFLSECIKFNYNATWAEFVANVMVLYRFPFIETALILKEEAQRYGLFYFQDATFIRVKWSPRPARITDADFKRSSSMEDDWNTISVA